MNLDFIISHFSWLGPWFFFLGATAEALPIIGTFLPGATIVTFGGFAAAHGYFSLDQVLIFSIIGAIIGDTISYYIGAHGGKLIRRKKIISDALLQKGENFFHKYGNQSLLWGRFIGPIRSIIPFMAGISKVKQETFWLWNIISGVIWGIVYVLLGYFSGNLFVIVTKHWNFKTTWILLLVSAVSAILWLAKHHGESIKQYFTTESYKFARRVEKMQFIKKLEQRYPALSEFFIGESAQLKLYFLTISLVLLVLASILELIFDWV